MTSQELQEMLKTVDPQQHMIVRTWLERGDGVAVYRNEDLSHNEVGSLAFVSYGSAAAMLEQEEPPQRMPDIQGMSPNWRYMLVGTYRGTP